MAQLRGCDISSNNRNWRNIVSNKANEFVIVKATEGRTYKSPVMDEQAQTVIKKGKLLGFYHYARPENGNNPYNEAANFVKAVKPYLGQCVLALDYEGVAHNYGTSWAAEFIREVKRLTGVLPMFYTSEAYLSKYADVAATNAGLWVAKYSKKSPVVSPWKIKAVWQYSSSPYDKNIFYGSKSAWLAYAKVNS